MTTSRHAISRIELRSGFVPRGGRPAPPRTGPKVGRNEPCPCGSGIKYKRCCLGGESAAEPRGEAAEVAAEIREALGDRRFTSLEEANEAIRETTARRNTAPREEFSGLSPEQVYRLLHLPFDSPGLVTFAESFAAPREAPLMSLFPLLAAALEGGGLRGTAKGNLPRAFCREAHDAFLRLHPPESVSTSPFFKLTSEEDFLELHLLRLLAGMAGLVRKYRGKFLLTAKGREAAADATGCRTFAAIFRPFASRVNWAYFDRHPGLGIVQSAVFYSLLLLQRHGTDFRPERYYADLFLRAFPAALEECPPAPWSTPGERFARCYALRTFSRFTALLGLAESRPIAGGERYGPGEIRKTPALDAFVRFTV